MAPDVRTAPPGAGTDDDGDWARRKQQLLAAAGVIAVVAVIAAAVFWYAGSGGSGGTAPLPQLPVSVGDHALVLGPASAPHTVVIHEDFGDAASRRWDQATRDFLAADATADLVRVEYHPVASAPSGYGTAAAIAFGAVLTEAGPQAARHARGLHALLFDRPDSTGTPSIDRIVRWASRAGASGSAVRDALQAHDLSWVRAANAQAERAGVRRIPSVLLDGREVTGATLIDRADRLERALAGS